MQELDIRPKELEEKCEILRQEDIKNFFNDKSKFQSVNCPACSSEEYKEDFKKGEFIFCRCQKCNSLFVSPRPNSEQLSNFYSFGKSIAFWSDFIFPLSEEVRMKNIFKPRANLINNLLKKYYLEEINTLLDVGAGNGSFLVAIRELNLAKRYIAVEPSEKAAQKCRDFGFEVMEQMIEDINLEEPVDIIVNFELIEHLFEPRSFIRSCSKNLKTGGIFIVTTPNIEGFDLAILGELSDNIVGPNHLNYFNTHSLRDLLKEEGFEELEILTPGELDVDIIKNKILSQTINEKNLPFWGSLIKNNQNNFNKSLQHFLQENKLSSNMMLVFRKNK